jgi:hypothetical protein
MDISENRKEKKNIYHNKSQDAEIDGENQLFNLVGKFNW